jgi:DsbC/DsbD-like thiol-disulfide interchange protein
MPAVTRYRLRIMALALAVMARAAPVEAQDASTWDKQLHAAARLISGASVKSPDAPYLRAGLELRLDPGWKTYWRYPGDSGLPPTFDFSGSDNVKSVTVAWPAPERFPDGAGGNSIGYVGHLILPLKVVPQDASKHAALRLKLGYDVCENMCVPAEASLALTLAGNGAEDAAIVKEELRVPRRVAPGPGKGFGVVAAHREPGGAPDHAHDRVIVTVAAPKHVVVDLFVEGPTPDWSLPLPEPAGSDGDLRRFAFDLDGLPPDAHGAGATLTFTLTSAEDAVEVPIHLD